MLLALILSACSAQDQTRTAAAGTPVTGAQTSPAAGEPEQTVPAAAPEPTAEPTTEPLAAIVNGEAIPLAAYELEVARYEAGFTIRGVDPATQGDYQAAVLDLLINDRLVVQAARSKGFTVTDAELQSEYERSVTEAGGEGPFQEWLALNLYTPDEYREQLRAGILANRAQSDVVASIPAATEQVHARHILVPTEEDASAILEQLANGADFATLAVNNSQDQGTRINGGDLGWFPRGVLTVMEVEEAAFGQEPGAVSDIVSTFLGYHVVETLAFDPARPVSPELRLLLQQAAVDEWLAELKAQATIERFVP
ncbi:MAG: peptidylprolyl isomerase [Anaerolineales bacterium]